MLSEALMKFEGKKELVEIYTNTHETTNFHIGYVMTCTDEHCAMALISPEGLFDGYMLERIEDIYKIQSDGMYERKMNTLMKYRNTKVAFIELDSGNLVGSFLEYARSTGSIVSIELFDSGNISAQGFVELLDTDTCSIRQVSNFGEKDGECTIRLDDISQISMNGETESMLEILHIEYSN